MRQLLQIELFKIFRRPRTYISFGIVTAFSFIVQLAMLTDGKSYMAFAMQGINEQFDVHGNILNGYFITYIILQSLLIQIPLLIALIAGDTLAGEANLGTLRLILTKPVTRNQLVLVKFLSSFIYTALLIIWLALVSLFLSLLIFGQGDMINLKSNTFILLLQGDVMWRYAAAFGFAMVAMTTIASLSIFLSAFADNSIGPIISTMGIVVVLTLLSNLEIPLFSHIKPFIFTSHMIAWKGFFDDPVPYGAILNSTIVMVVYTLLFISATMLYFNKKDIKS